MASWTNPIDYSVGQATCVQRFDEQILDNLTFSGCHAHSGAAGDGLAISGSLSRSSSGIQVANQYLTLLPFLPASQTATNSIVYTGTDVNYGLYRIVNTKGASAKYSIDCDKGTWTISMYYSKNSGAGIISACFNGASIGQIDTYNATTVHGNLSNASTFSISSSGTYTLKLESTASNVSSTGYEGNIAHIELRRLSA